MTNLKIGTQVYLIHKRTIDEKLKNGDIVIGKIQTYCLRDKKILPVIKVIGSKFNADVNMHYMYINLDHALNALKPKRSKKK